MSEPPKKQQQQGQDKPAPPVSPRRTPISVFRGRMERSIRNPLLFPFPGVFNNQQRFTLRPTQHQGGGGARGAQGGGVKSQHPAQRHAGGGAGPVVKIQHQQAAGSGVKSQHPPQRHAGPVVKIEHQQAVGGGGARRPVKRQQHAPQQQHQGGDKKKSKKSG